MAPVWFIMLLLVLVPAMLVFIAGIVVYAIVKNRPGIIAVAGGGLLLLLILGGATLLLGYREVRMAPGISNAHLHVGPASLDAHFVAPQFSHINTPQFPQSQGRISVIGIMLLIVLPIVLVASFLGSISSKRHAPGRGGGAAWAVGFGALAVVAFAGLVAAKWVAAGRSQIEAAAIEARTANLQAFAARQQEIALRKVRVQHNKPAGAEADIHEMMDKFDEPRIPLAESPATVVAVADIREDKSDDSDANVEAEAKAALAVMAAENESPDEPAASAEKNDLPEKKAEASASPEPKKSQPAPPKRPAAEAPDSSQPRPSWVNDPPKRVGNVPREVIVTDEYATYNECARATDVYLLLKTYERLMELNHTPTFDESLPSLTFNDRNVMTENGRIISTDGGRTWNWTDPRIATLEQMGIGLDFVRRELVVKDGGEERQYFETIDRRTFGPMHKLYTQIEFTPSVDRELRAKLEVANRKGRLIAVGALSGGTLGLLGVVFGLLKVDTWTKGYYSKRLFLGVPAAIIGLGTLFAFLLA